MLEHNVYTIIAQCCTNNIYPWMKGKSYTKLSNGICVKINLKAYLITSYDSISDNTDLTMVDDMLEAYHLSYIDGYPEYDLALLKIDDSLLRKSKLNLTMFDKNLSHIPMSNELYIKHLDDNGITFHKLKVLNPYYKFDHFNSMQYVKIPLIEFQLDSEIDEELLSGIAGSPIICNNKIMGIYTKYDMDRNICIGVHSSIISHMIKTFRSYKKCIPLPFATDMIKGRYTKDLLKKTLRNYGEKIPITLARTLDSVCIKHIDNGKTLRIPYDHAHTYVVISGLIFTTFTERMLIEHNHRNICFSQEIINNLCDTKYGKSLIVLLGIEKDKPDKISKFVIDNNLPYIPNGDEYDLLVLDKVNDININSIVQLDQLHKKDPTKILKFTNGLKLEL